MKSTRQLFALLLLLLWTLPACSDSTAQEDGGSTASDASAPSEASHERVPGQSLLWKISGNGLDRPSYLFGTYHLLNDSYLEEMPDVRQAFDQADGIAVELVIKDEFTLKQAEALMLEEGKLEDLLDAPTYAKLDEKCKELLKVPAAAMNQMKPMAVSISLSLTQLMEDMPEMQSYQGTPMDKYFAEEALRKGIPIHEFETFEEQMEILFNSTPLEEEIKQLKLLLDDWDKFAGESVDLVHMYFRQDLQSMTELAEGQLELYGGGEELLVKRNANWMQQMPDLLAQGNQFIAVGALHLSGEVGLITQLRAAGYTVEPVEPEN